MPPLDTIATESMTTQVGLSQIVKSRIISCHDPESVELASTSINAGECVVVPTETIYGLTCDALNEEAVCRLYETKGRDISKPSSVFVANVAEISGIAEIGSPMVDVIIRRFLPGPLTVVLNSKLKDVAGVVGTDGKIGIRISSHHFIQALCQEARTPLIATSANISGASDCRTDREVLAAFEGVVAIIVLETMAMTERATTVVDLSGRQPILLREGTIPFSEVLNFAEGIS